MDIIDSIRNELDTLETEFAALVDELATAQDDSATLRAELEACQSGREPMSMNIGISAVQSDSNKAMLANADTIAESVSSVNIHIHGWGMNGDRINPSPGVYDWSTLRDRINAVPAGIGVVLTMCGCPSWMKAGDWSTVPINGDPTQPWTYTPPHPDHYGHFADLAAAAVVEFPRIVMVQCWNEMKGFWVSAGNRWWSEGYLSLYETMLASVEAVAPAMPVAGPYVVIGTYGADYPSRWLPDSPPGIGIDRRYIDVLDAWVARGYDLRHPMAIDPKNGNRDEVEPPDRWLSLGEQMRWIVRRYGTERPIICSEWYARPSSPSVSVAEKVSIVAWSLIETAEAGINTVLLWQMLENGSAHPIGLFNPDNTPTELVAVLSWLSAHLPGDAVVLRPSSDELVLDVDGDRLSVSKVAPFTISIETKGI